MKKMVAVFVLLMLALLLAGCDDVDGYVGAYGDGVASTDYYTDDYNTEDDELEMYEIDVNEIESDWIDAYYDFLLKNIENCLFDTIKLIDLNFDGTPEILGIGLWSGRYGGILEGDTLFGLTYKNGEVLPIEAIGDAVFLGVAQDLYGNKTWLTLRSAAPRRWPSASQSAIRIDFSNLFDIVTEEVLVISFTDINAYIDNTEIIASASWRRLIDNEFIWEEIDVTAEENKLYVNWYENHNFELGQGIHLLPHLYLWMSELNLISQKYLIVDIRIFEYDENGISNSRLISREEFRTALIQWNNATE